MLVYLRRRNLPSLGEREKETKRFREIVKVLDKVGIRSARNTGYKTRPGSRTLQSLRSGQRDSLLSHRESLGTSVSSRGGVFAR